MTDQPITEAEQEAAWRLSMAFNSEAARSGLFAAAIDIAETMKANGVPHGEACLVTGAVEFAVQLWQQVMIQAGKTPKEAREALEKQVRFFWNKHKRLNAEGEAQEVTKQ